MNWKLELPPGPSSTGKESRCCVSWVTDHQGELGCCWGTAEVMSGPGNLLCRTVRSVENLAMPGSRLTEDLDSSETNVWVPTSWKEPHQELRANGTWEKSRKRKLF